MKYEKTGNKAVSADKAALSDLRNVNSSKVIWYLVKRHKTGILLTWAVAMTLLYLLPFLPGELFNLVS